MARIDTSNFVASYNDVKNQIKQVSHEVRNETIYYDDRSRQKRAISNALKDFFSQKLLEKAKKNPEYTDEGLQPVMQELSGIGEKIFTSGITFNQKEYNSYQELCEARGEYGDVYGVASFLTRSNENLLEKHIERCRNLQAHFDRISRDSTPVVLIIDNPEVQNREKIRSRINEITKNIEIACSACSPDEAHRLLNDRRTDLIVRTCSQIQEMAIFSVKHAQDHFKNVKNLLQLKNESTETLLNDKEQFEIEMQRLVNHVAGFSENHKHVQALSENMFPNCADTQDRLPGQASNSPQTLHFPPPSDPHPTQTSPVVHSNVVIQDITTKQNVVIAAEGTVTARNVSTEGGLTILSGNVTPETLGILKIMTERK